VLKALTNVTSNEYTRWYFVCIVNEKWASGLREYGECDGCMRFLYWSCCSDVSDAAKYKPFSFSSHSPHLRRTHRTVHTGYTLHTRAIIAIKFNIFKFSVWDYCNVNNNNYYPRHSIAIMTTIIVPILIYAIV